MYRPELGAGPVGAALHDAIVADIERGRLVPDERLPGTRSLAESLGVSRGTVVRAFSDLEAEGWLVSRAGSGFRIHPDLDPQRRRATDALSVLGFDLAPGPPPSPERGAVAPFALLGGHPDLRLLPLKELARAYGRVLRGRGRRLVGYGEPGGEDRLKASLSQWLADTRGVRPVDGGLLVTRGSQMALYLSARALIRPGDRVGVESFGYRPAWEALTAAGAELVSIAVDEDGATVDDLPSDLRAVYLTPHHQYPTGATLSAPRRQRLLAWARAHRVAILEDDYDHEYHYDGPPVRPLAAQDTGGVVISIGTLSKAFAPGLRLGWVLAPPPLIERLTRLRLTIDRQGDRVVEHAVAELIDEGTLGRHLRRTRRVYRERRDVLLDAIARDLPFVEPHVRPGGLALWCRVHDLDVDTWSARSLEAGVQFETGRRYTLDGRSIPWIRLGFACHTPDELRDAIRRMRATAR